MSFTASSSQGSAPCRITIRSSGKSKHTWSKRSTCWHADGNRGPAIPALTTTGMSSSTHVAYTAYALGSSTGTWGRHPAGKSVTAARSCSSFARRMARTDSITSFGLTSSERRKRPGYRSRASSVSRVRPTSPTSMP